ncbi:peptidase domain-containing ABC transporter [Salibacter halophilus]|uniref:ATP-binding cassette domain-containing protein n=1 Tax=Salibacter halophilus TaxID=1803916 RepID=A0A6N6M3Y9_9FLAO|nr:ATP-binding cassette domain-containing protein [Salibacter halophilus]KAB1062123.1 ATP-binding cassette domain-containing protein [Salibacter halophilus]
MIEEEVDKKTSKKKNPVYDFFNLLSPDKKDIIYMLTYTVFNGLVNLILPLGIQAIIGLIMGGAALSSSWVILVIVVTLGVMFSGSMQIMQLFVAEVIQQRIFTRASFSFSWRIPKFKTEGLQDLYPPELMNRFFDTMTIQKGLSKLLIDFVSAIIQIIFGLLLLAAYHPVFIAFSLLLIVMLYVIFKFTGAKGLNTSIKESTYKYQLVYWLEEMARTMDTFKIIGKSKLPFKRTDSLVVNYLGARKKHFNILVYQYGSIILFKTIITAGLLIVGSLLVIEQEINLGQFVAAEIIILIILTSVEKLLLSIETIYDVLTATDKLGVVTDVDIEDNREGNDANELFGDEKAISVKLKNITYKGLHGRELLKSIDLEINKGERICITGYNGSGKGILTNLFSGMLEEFTGELSYNGYPFGNFQLESLRSNIGDVLPYEDVFDGSILENIVMGRDISMKTVREVVAALGMENFIQNQKDGLNEPILAEGKYLSKSVLRKIKIARAIVCDPKLLVMEEFMHNLQKSERERLANYLTDKNHLWTLIGVSNDTLFASKCDRILIMKEGQIIDQGTFTEIKTKPYFDELFIQ